MAGNISDWTTPLPTSPQAGTAAPRPIAEATIRAVDNVAHVEIGNPAASWAAAIAALVVLRVWWEVGDKS